MVYVREEEAIKKEDEGGKVGKEVVGILST